MTSWIKRVVISRGMKIFSVNFLKKISVCTKISWRTCFEPLMSARLTKQFSSTLSEFGRTRSLSPSFIRRIPRIHKPTRFTVTASCSIARTKRLWNNTEHDEDGIGLLTDLYIIIDFFLTFKDRWVLCIVTDFTK